MSDYDNQSFYDYPSSVMSVEEEEIREDFDYSQIIFVPVWKWNETTFIHYPAHFHLIFLSWLQYYLCSCLMSLVAVSVFLRVDYLLKLIIMSATAGVHLFLVSYVNKQFFASYYDDYNDGWDKT